MTSFRYCNSCVPCLRPPSLPSFTAPPLTHHADASTDAMHSSQICMHAWMYWLSTHQLLTRSNNYRPYCPYNLREMKIMYAWPKNLKLSRCSAKDLHSPQYIKPSWLQNGALGARRPWPRMRRKPRRRKRKIRKGASREILGTAIHGHELTREF